MRTPKSKILLLLIGLTLILILPWLGGERLNLSEIFQSNTPDHRIFFELRLPRYAFVLLVGGILATVGVVYQVLFSNPLAEPYVLGISSAVTLGAVIGEVYLRFPPRSAWLFLIGLVFSCSISFLFTLLQKRRIGTALERIVLFGMGINFVLSSILFLILSFQSQSVGGGTMRWLFGNVPWLNSSEVFFYAFTTLPFIAILFIFGRALDAMTLGDSIARTLGFSPTFTRNILFFTSSLLLTIISSAVGAIGFVGLVVPHVIRLSFRPSNSRALLGLSFCVGGLFLALSDALSRSLLPPFEFPIGIITTLLGGPLFLYLLWKR